VKLSLSIPYRQRLHNIKLAFEGLANQSMDKSEFEVIVSAMEYSEEYVIACRAFTDRLNIVSVVSSYDFEIPRARNMAMRQAIGDVIVQMDADTFLPPDALRTLYDRHFSFGQNACVVGQVVGYGNNNDGDVTATQDLPYEHYLAVLDGMTKAPDWPADPRFQVAHVIPWAFGWTGLIALPADTVRTHQLFFDENFHGWGVDDLEWSYRVCASGIPIVLSPDVYALHLPHLRDSAANRVTEAANYRRFLRKWPRYDVELAHAFGDVAANSLFLEYQRELRTVAGDGALGTVRGRIDGGDVVVLGVLFDASHRIVDRGVLGLFDDRTDVERLPVAGLALPYDELSADECRVLPRINTFSPRYRDAVFAEAARVGKQVVRVTDAT
jgi:glycosyltransferase involved in cell wall biosynthesis